MSIKAETNQDLILVSNNNTILTLNKELKIQLYAKFEEEVQSLEQQIAPKSGFIVSGFKGNYSGSIFHVNNKNEIDWAIRNNFVENQPIKTSVIGDFIYYM